MHTRSEAKKTTSMGSEGSQGSLGIGEGILPPGARDDLPPNLTPEGFSLDPNIKVYDVIVYLIYCPEHEKVVVTNVDRARCVWLPFVWLNENITWKKACKDGVNNVIGNTNPELDSKQAAMMTPEYDINYLSIFRIQMPTTEKFITRLANFVMLKKGPDIHYKCCQSSARVTWVPVADILCGKIDKIWGPELITYTKMLLDKSIKTPTSITTEFTLKNCLYYLLLDESEEQALLNECQVKAEHIMEIYENYLEHCYPSFGMSFESFRHYLAKYGYNKNDQVLLLRIYHAFGIFGRGYLEFHEIMLGIIAMEPSTKQSNRCRARLIVRYYDKDFSGFLSTDELNDFVKDVYKEPTLAGEALKSKVAEIVNKGLEISADGKVLTESIVKLLCSGAFSTDHLCRNPKAILPQISRLIEIKIDGKTKTVDQSLKSPKKGDDTCAGCHGTNYDYSLHAVTLDTNGRCVEPRIINEDWIISCPSEMMNAHKYSIEYVFSLNSVPNTFLDIIKDFYNKSIYPGGEPSIGLMSAKEDWTVIVKYVSILCGELKGLLTNEKKMPKINSPAIVIGDLQGNLHDLFEIEKHLFQAFPTTPYNLVFLGNYSGFCKYGMECIFYLFALKMCSPNKVFLLRGTNEMYSQNKKTLLIEAHRKYGQIHGKKIFDLVNDIFQRLPFAIIIDETIFCAHSGISKSNKICKLNLIKGDVISVLKDAPVAYDVCLYFL